MSYRTHLFYYIVSVLLGLLLAIPAGLESQVNVQRNTTLLNQLADRYAKEYQEEYQRAVEVARQKNWPIRREFPDGKVIELQGISTSGAPVYYKTMNLDAAESVSTDRVWPTGDLGFGLTGAGMTAGEWDAGDVRATHQEFGSRVTDGDASTGTHDHATHVAGTIMAAGVNPDAQGMAYQANLTAYGWGSDISEMSAEAAGGLILSNHSYGKVDGWAWDFRDDGLWAWLGDVDISTTEDADFGSYDNKSMRVDTVANAAPYYLPVIAAANDRNDSGPSPGTPYWYLDSSDNWVKDSTNYPNPDGQYDCIPGGLATAKNVLTVGAVQDVPGGYSQPSDVNMSNFSSWGPVDDGRIKPDISANGVNLFSPTDSTDSFYANKSGTSMASPSTTGSLLLLQELYQKINSGNMLAATLKALVIHTADEAGSNPGPDYQFGWGLLNTAKAASVLSNEGMSRSNLVRADNLSSGEDFTLTVRSDGDEPLRATIVWNDPAGTPPGASLDPTDKMLVNDLDLYLNGPSQTHQPYLLDPANPGNAATTGDNITDNVEQVYIAAPEAGEYILHVNHKGSLQGGSQNFSLVVSGASALGSNGPMPKNLVAGQGFDGIVPLTWDPPQDVAPESQVMQGQESETSVLRDHRNGQTSENTGERESASLSLTRTVDYYKIYRKDDPVGTYQVIGQIDPDDRYYYDEEDFIDRNVTNDSTYYYAVSAVYEDGTEGSLTDPVTGTPSSAGYLVQSEYDASLYGGASFDLTPADTSSTDDINVTVVNNSTELNIFITDYNNDETSDYNEVGIYFDTNNNGTWDSSLPSNEGNLWISTQNSSVSASFRSIYGTYPNDVHGGPIVDNPEGISYSVSDSYGEIDYDITIDLQESVINAQPGDTIGFRVYNLDMSQFSDVYYGMDIWPYGNIWLAPETYGKLVLGTEIGTAASSPTITSVDDYPRDQGGQLKVDWSSENTDGPTDYYTVWTRNNDGTLSTGNAGKNGAQSTADIGSEWVVADTVIAEAGKSEYSATVPTVGDSSAAGIPWVEVKVKSHMEDKSEESSVRQGYSVDNLAPITPAKFDGIFADGSVQLSWQANSEPDIAGYTISRALSSRFSDSDDAAQRYTTSDTTYRLKGTDAGEYYYRISAKDVHGNKSDPSQPITIQSTGADNELTTIPDDFELKDNYPNPFNPMTNVRYGIPEQTHVNVTIYDLLGNKINTLVDQRQNAGWYTVQWYGDNALGHQVGTGVYLLRIQAGETTDTQKMVFMK